MIRGLQDQHRREVAALDEHYATKERELDQEKRQARRLMAERHAAELAEAWRAARKDTKP